MLYLMFGLAAVFLVISIAAQAVLHKPVIAIVAGVHEHLVDHLERNGEGKLLDIGCGAAALTVRCAKAFPKAQITAMDYWGAEWSYAKEQCERNARIEGVADRITFQKGDAAKLDFPDETFDAAVSNFVFHEVRSVKDKRDGNPVWKKIDSRKNICKKYRTELSLIISKKAILYDIFYGFIKSDQYQRVIGRSLLIPFVIRI